MPIPAVRLLTDAVFALLDAHTALTVYRSVVEAPPVDTAGNALGYAVLHPGGGDAGHETLAAVPGRLLWSFQVTCAGGDHDYLLWAVDTVRGLLDGKTLTVAGANVGLLQPPLGFNPPPPKPDQDAQPPRMSVPLQYQVLTVPA